MWYWFFKLTLVRPVVRFGFRARIEGAEHVPARGGAILASNHVSAADTLILPALLRRRVTFPAKAELFKGDRGPVSKVVAWALRAVGQVPLDRSGGRVSVAGMQPVLDVLLDGGLVGIYPEGTRSPDGRLYKGKTGAAWMALATGVPIIPVAMIDSQLSRRLGIPWTDRPIVRIGRPIDVSRYADERIDPRTLRRITDEVMNEIRLLSGQEYVPTDATVIKRRARNRPDPEPPTG